MIRMARTGERKKQMKEKLIALLLVCALVLTQFAALAEELEEETAEALPERIQAEQYTQLVVGNVTRMQGDFFTAQWGNSTTDADVRNLLHGYNLIKWDGMLGVFTTEPSVVNGIVVMQNDEGDRSFILSLFDDLCYSDGTAITAWDYAFSILLRSSPEMRAIGAKTPNTVCLSGYQAYASGSARYFAGVDVINDYTLMLTVDHEYLPFFYEMGMLDCVPYPIAAIAPGVRVRDDGQGAYLANEDPTVSEPVFTEALLRQTILDPDTGYLSHPSVVSGPYCLTAWDGLTAEFDINPCYKGNSDGVKPLIPHLVYTLAENETMVDKLLEGEFGLLNKVMSMDAILQGMAAMADGSCQMSNYPRSGMSFVAFACEKDTVASKAVRQAIAWCVDRDALTQDYTGNFGLRVDGYYGIGQWMYGAVKGTIAEPFDPPENEGDAQAQAEYEANLEAWAALSLDDLTVYTLDTETAIRLLEQDGWTLNDEGIRQKTIGDKTVTLDLVLAYPEGNRIDQSLENELIPHLNEVGIRLRLEPMEMRQLLQAYHQKDGRSADMFYLATNFDMVFDPSAVFSETDGIHYMDCTNCMGEELYQAARRMRDTEPGAILDYMNEWIAFQQLFNEELPMLPIYSNIYFDFYIGALHDYYISQSMTWSQAIVPAYMNDEDALEEDEWGEDEFEDDFGEGLGDEEEMFFDD